MSDTAKPQVQAQKPTTVINPTDGPILTFPPFPTLPQGVSITPFKDFKEHGIQIFSDTDIEIDALGIPTVQLGVAHGLDRCKTETRRKTMKKDEVLKGSKKGKIAPEKVDPEMENMTPMERKNHQRFLMFANKEWYDQWAEGEHLRGVKTYDPNLSSITRIHHASTDFRRGRMWPPPQTNLVYLWDQFRLYIGLLGSTPVWIRTDLSHPEDDEDGEDAPTRSSPLPPPPPQKKPPSPTVEDELDLGFDSSEGELDDKFIANKQPAAPSQPPRKWAPLRTPYELFNQDPIRVGSEAEVQALLTRAALEKEAKLLAFLNDPEKTIKVFLSSYMRKEGFIWTPSFLTYLPLLLSFFLSFLIRTRALPECERQLKRAVEIARQAATELPRTGRLCRILPDAMGKGAKGCWGTKWEEKWDFERVTAENDPKLPDKEEKEEAFKQFEEEVKKANLQLLTKETGFGSVPLRDESDDEEIAIQITSPTSPGPQTHTTTLISELVNSETTAADTLAPNTPPLPDSPPPASPKGNKMHISDDESEEEEEDAQSWASPTGRPPTRAEKLAKKAAWFPPITQPLMGILGMTVLPLRYEAGIAERSLRKVTSVLKPGEAGGGSNKWRGVEEELVKRLARVVLGPWSGWDDGGVAKEFNTPILVGGGDTSSSLKGEEGSENGKSGHDPLKDDITILVEPNVTNSLNLGMGVGGTWVQLIPLRSENGAGSGYGRGRGRGGGGRGRGGNRGGGNTTGEKESRFWYVEELSMAIPSFWTVGEKIKEIEVEEEDIDNVGRRWTK